MGDDLPARCYSLQPASQPASVTSLVGRLSLWLVLIQIGSVREFESAMVENHSLVGVALSLGWALACWTASRRHDACGLLGLLVISLMLLDEM